MRRLVLLALGVAVSSCGRQAQVGGAPASPARDAAITGADQLVAAMHERYAGKWYEMWSTATHWFKP